MNEVPGGLAAIHVSLSPWLLLALLVVVVFAGVKLSKLLWVLFK